MGYRSDIQLVINTSSAEKAQEVADALYLYGHGGNPGSSLMLEMLNKARQFYNAEVIHLEAQSWKVPEWDSMITDILVILGEDPEVDVAWVRIGEETTDLDMCAGDYTWPSITRMLDAPCMVDVPRQDSPLVPTVPVQTKCQCDMHQLMRGEGHDLGCPERA